MADGSSLIQQLDFQIEKLLSGWNIYSTIIAITLVTYLLYPIFFTPEPDTHPMLLADQATAAQIRYPGESAIFRSSETPHGYPLKTGLNVKEPGSPKWASGRDGDIRDIWRQALKNPIGPDEKEIGSPGKILTVLGKEEIIEYNFSGLTREINAVGNFINSHAGSRVAIYLPNSVEFLVTLFAAAFYGFTPILVSPKQSPESLASVLNQTRAEVLIAAAGTIPLKDLLKSYSNLKQIVWVVERASRHMDWNEVPEGIGGKTEVIVWHDVVNEKDPSISSEVPEISSNSVEPNIITAVKSSVKGESCEIIEFTQKNIVAAVAAQISVLPKTHRFGPADLLLPLESLSSIWALTLTLAALFSNSSIALTSAAGSNARYDVVVEGITPTIVVASATTMSQACKDKMAKTQGISSKIKFWRHANALASGIMPKPSKTAATSRLIYISSNADTESQPLHSADLFNLRIVTGSRLIYALTSTKVAGAIAQTKIFDYANRNSGSNEYSHFGPPLSSVQIKLKEVEGKSKEGEPIGWLVVDGPAVVDGETTLHQMMTITDSNTLCYL